MSPHPSSERGVAAPAAPRPFVIGIGGATRPGSSTEQALALALRKAEEAGCETQLFGGRFLAELPHYDQTAASRTDRERAFIDAIRRADGVILATPAYHAGVSGLVKNALDLIQETASDPRPYLDGVPVGLIVTAYGWQATGATLSAMRTIIHALRGWPTPLGVTINCGSGSPFNEDGSCAESRVADQLSTAALQVVGFARRMGPAAALN